MGLIVSIRDHILLGGPNAVAGWGLFALLVVSGGISAGRLVVDPVLFISVLVATLCTGNGIYALNAYYDRKVDAINKPRRPIPSGRMTPQHAVRYAKVLMVLGFLLSTVVSFVFGNYLVMVLWSVFTLLGIAYSTPPLKLKSRHIFGNLTFGAFAGLTFLIGRLLQERPVGTIDALAYVIFGTILVAGLITMKDFYDTEGDKASGDITLPVKVGKRWAAAISILFMTVPIIVPSLIWPPSTVESFIRSNFWYLIYIMSFGVYIGLESVGERSIFSDPYARVQYYFVILLAAYQFLKEPLGISWGAFAFLEGPAIIILYGMTAFAAVYHSWKAKQDILKPVI